MEKNKIKNIIIVCLLTFSVNVFVYGQTPSSDSIYNATMNEAMKNAASMNVPSAIFYLKKAIEIRPDAPAPYHELSKMYDTMADAGQTIYYAKKAFSLAENNLWYEEFLLSSAVKYKKYDVALSIQEPRYQRDDECFSDLMNLYFLTSSWDKALSVLSSYEKKHGTSVMTMQYRLKIYMEQKDFKNALKQVDALLKKEPDNTSFARQKLLVLHSQGKTDVAWKYFSQYYQSHPNDGAAAYTMMTYYNEHQSFDALLGCLNVVVADTAISSESRMHILESVAPILAQDTVYLAPFEKALTTYTQTPNDNYVSTYAYAGDYYFAKGDKNAAKNYLKKALHAGMTDAQKILKLLYLEGLDSEYKSMYTDASLAIASGVEDVDVFIQCGYAAYQLGNIKAGIDCLEKAKKISKDASVSVYSQLCGMLSSFYYEDNQLDKSDENSQMALSINPDDATVLNNYAYYLALRNKDSAKAKKMSEKSLVIEPENDSFLDTYAYILYLEKDYTKALEYVEKAMKFSKNPSNGILEHYRDILLAMGKKEKAQMIQNLIEKSNDKNEPTEQEK